ncbi:hypothetical protein, partial [Escherichia coli]|uniref:hypothetical protein n=1 Tax=Escherichia coli TaxID=562 RepID=UPI0039E0A25D
LFSLVYCKMSVGSTHHLEVVFVWKQNYILNEKKTTLDINFRTDNNQLQTKENRNERENN